MAYVSSDQSASAPPSLGALLAGFAAFRDGFAAYRRKRAVYLRTLGELQSYRPHELHDLRVQPSDFEELARRQAGL